MTEFLLYCARRLRVRRAQARPVLDSDAVVYVTTVPQGEGWISFEAARSRVLFRLGRARELVGRYLAI